MIIIPKTLELELTGNVVSGSEAIMLRTSLSSFPSWLEKLLGDYKISGAVFTISELDDLSGFGVDMKWLTPEEIISECVDFEPGISVASLGFIPVGSCLTGSGDPYFIDVRGPSMDPPLVRIPHDAAVEKPYPLDEIDVVCASLSDFFYKAVVK